MFNTKSASECASCENVYFHATHENLVDVAIEQGMSEQDAVAYADTHTDSEVASTIADVSCVCGQTG